MKAPTAIRRRNKAERSTGFERLRAEGLALVQKTCGEIWTDHNLHDPGITMLEALCFALTETAFRAEFPVEDLLTGPDGEIDFNGLALHPPHEAFVCGATTPDDHRCRLLDRVDGLDDAVLVPPPDGPHHLTGVMRLRLKLADSLDEAQRIQVKRHAVHVYRAERGLGEDIDVVVAEVQPRDCWLQGEIEIGGAHDGVELLAEVYHRASIYIEGRSRFLTRRALREQGLGLDQIYDGPVLEKGFPPRVAKADTVRERCYVGDLLHFLRTTVPGIQAIHRLQLLTGQPESTVLDWCSDDQAMRLLVPGDNPLRQPPQRVQLRRRSQSVAIDAEELRLRVAALQAADRARRLRDPATLLEEQATDLPQGRYRPTGPYRSVQYDFPALYGLGEHGVPQRAGEQRQAQARQLQGYLMIFDQVIANSRAQTSHLHELFSVEGEARRTYWWELLDKTRVPGSAELLEFDLATGEEDPKRQEFVREVLMPLDQSAKRRHHLLDHLLALHGERLVQNAMRQYAAHLTASELEQLLLRNKVAYLRDVVPLLRYRARGFDYSRPSWSHRHRDNFSGLARRTCLLLGFRHDRARSLMVLFKRLRRQRVAAVEPLKRLEQKEGKATQPAWLPMLGRETPRRSDLLKPLTLWRGLVPPTRLLRAGAAHDGYGLLSTADDQGTILVLRESSHGPWWALHTFEGGEHRADAIAAAGALRDSLCQLNDACEGLHLVEHVLLRPLTASNIPSQDSDCNLRLTAVFPDWTVRTAQEGFRRLAEETLHINCPAHLDLHVVWLNPDQMLEFESAYQAWMRLRRELCQAEFLAGPEALTLLYSKVDAASLQVRAWLERKTS